jgi:hypothetical protein
MQTQALIQKAFASGTAVPKARVVSKSSVRAPVVVRAQKEEVRERSRDLKLV